jgi:hypothetical protein
MARTGNSFMKNVGAMTSTSFFSGANGTINPGATTTSGFGLNKNVIEELSAE